MYSARAEKLGGNVFKDQRSVLCETESEFSKLVTQTCNGAVVMAGHMLGAQKE